LHEGFESPRASHTEFHLCFQPLTEQGDFTLELSDPARSLGALAGNASLNDQRFADGSVHRLAT
jgi:hypothetical protein